MSIKYFNLINNRNKDMKLELGAARETELFHFFHEIIKSKKLVIKNIFINELFRAYKSSN